MILCNICTSSDSIISITLKNEATRLDVIKVLIDGISMEEHVLVWNQYSVKRLRSLFKVYYCDKEIGEYFISDHVAPALPNIPSSNALMFSIERFIPSLLLTQCQSIYATKKTKNAAFAWRP